MIFVVATYGNHVPLIGILTIPANQGNWVRYAPGYIENYTTSLVVADYAQWIQSGGADWIPIIFDDEWEIITNLIPQLNGILFQGGAGEYDPNTLYYIRFNQILSFLRQYANQHQPQSIPLWSTCLGFEGLLAATSKDYRLTLSDFDALELMSNIKYTQYAMDDSITFNAGYINKVYKDMIIDYTSNYDILYQDHSYGVTPHAFENDAYLSGNFSNLGVSYDRNGVAFVSLLESKVLPNGVQLSWYASQFHPEKAAYQFTNWYWPNDNSHTVKAVITNQYFSQFFVNECRIRNDNTLNKDTQQLFMQSQDYKTFFIGKGQNTLIKGVNFPYETAYWFPQ